jgi:hypothetical protein
MKTLSTMLGLIAQDHARQAVDAGLATTQWSEASLARSGLVA